MTATSGYSGTPLPRKLGIKPGCTLLLLGAPAGIEETLGALPDGVRIRRRGATADLAIWFVRSVKELEEKVALRATQVGSDGLWICWPKKASGVATDLSESLVREAALAHGIVDYKVAAIDATWSGLKFARRRQPPEGSRRP